MYLRTPVAIPSLFPCALQVSWEPDMVSVRRLYRAGSAA